MNLPRLLSRIQALNRQRRIVPLKLSPHLRTLPAVRAVLFDVYGTLVDSTAKPSRDYRTHRSRRTFRRQLRSTLRLAGLNASSPRAALAICNTWRQCLRQARRLCGSRGIDYPEVDIRRIWRQTLQLARQNGWVRQRIKAGLVARVAIAFESLQNPVALMPGLPAALERLRQAGFRLGIVSNAQFYTPLILQALLGKSLNRAGFDRDLCVWSYRLGRAKPSDYLLKLALQRLRQKYGLTPRQVLVIGNDWNNDLAPARRAGCRTALMVGSVRSFAGTAETARRAPADLLLTNWSQLESIFTSSAA
ncbi:MAG: HAD family hydrolase [Lentisphaerae bacterium]|nr:HAD family hydrolase [Lentisphaerota bacterium]